MPKHRFLFIVEGDHDEPAFVKQLFKKCYASVEFQTFVYHTNLHNLAKLLDEEYPEFDDGTIDIQLILKSQETSKRKCEMLSGKYTDVYLIFDFEPQQDFPRFSTIRRMLAYFNDPTDHGKLFINYPMMQSFKHFSTLPDPGFKDLTVSIEECRTYKQLVGRISRYTDVGKYDYSLFMSLAIHHLKKAYFVLSDTYVIPELKEYLSWDYVKIFDKQVFEKDKNGKVFVLNTCIFALVDFRPSSFFMQLRDRGRQFLI